MMTRPHWLFVTGKLAEPALQRLLAELAPRAGFDFNIQVLPITQSLVEAATALSQQHELLTGDALVVAVMQQHGITILASEDGDLDRVPWLKRYGPV